MAAGERSGLGDLYWLSAHGQALPQAAWPAVLFVRERLGEPYAWAILIQAIAGGLDRGEKEV